MMSVVTLIISWAFPIVVVVYLVMLTRFVGTMKSAHQDYWRSIGDPGLWDPNGQALILGKVFLPNRLPEQVVSRHKGSLIAIRGLALLGILLFAAILLMIWLGVYEQ